MSIALVFILYSIISPGAERLDPHGNKNLIIKNVHSLKDHNQCTVCHSEAKGEIKLKAGAMGSCTNCHNKFPHAGAADHLGKIYSSNEGKTKETITCVSCHSPHRSEGKSWESKNSSRPEAMIRRTCSECHIW